MEHQIKKFIKIGQNMLKKKNFIKDASGFTMPELLIAASILVFGLISMASFTGNIVNKNGKNQKRTTATALAQQQIENLRAQSLPSANNLTHGTTTQQLTGEYSIYTMTTAINIAPNPDVVTVTVSWPDSGTDNNVSLTTLMD